MYGVITKYFNDKGYGFIQSMTNGETYFIHKKDLRTNCCDSRYGCCIRSSACKSCKGT